MKKIIIGFSSRITTPNGVRKQFINERYLTYFQNKGLNTLLITLNDKNPENVLDLCDGFIITGGDDITPSYFNEENLGSTGCDLKMDEGDKLLYEYAVKTKKPLLGICRGIQAINVFGGGSLIQDIDSIHQDKTHLVYSVDNEFGWPKEFKVNSYHHQALKKLAKDYEIIARSDDNFIEAIKHRFLPIYGVQWHPEMMQDDENTQKLFDYFINLLKKESSLC